MNGTLLVWVAAAVLGGDPPPAHRGGGDGEKASAVVVQCRADAEIRGTDVLLRDIADVRTDDVELAERLGSLSFGKRPAVGFNRLLSQQDIKLRLAQEGLRDARLQMTGATQVLLHPVMTRVEHQELLDAADPVLRAALELDSDKDIEFEPAGAKQQLFVPPGRFSMDLRARLRDGKLQYSSAIVDVTVLVDDEEYRTVPLPYRLRRYQKAAIARTAIKRGVELNEDNVELRRVEAAQGTTPWITDLDAIRGKVAAQDLQGGQMLAVRSLADPAVVLRGDPVNLVAISSRMQVATRAVALGDGAVGDRIPVRNLTAGKIVQATVRGAGLVVIEASATK